MYKKRGISDSHLGHLHSVYNVCGLSLLHWERVMAERVRVEQWWNGSWEGGYTSVKVLSSHHPYCPETAIGSLCYTDTFFSLLKTAEVRSASAMQKVKPRISTSQELKPSLCRTCREDGIIDEYYSLRFSSAFASVTLTRQISMKGSKAWHIWELLSEKWFELWRIC